MKVIKQLMKAIELNKNGKEYRFTDIRRHEKWEGVASPYRLTFANQEARESVATYEVCANQLEEEIKEHKKKHRQELMNLKSAKELLQQELKRDKTTISDLERKSRLQSSVPDQNINAYLENGGNFMRNLSSAGSLGSMEKSCFLQASLDSSENFSEKGLVRQP
ncbi:hypothetical protein MKW98_008858 [Papaver atlanticum]|uniref:Uncharacterized protein n=1 Tax=Papaver atlanticum TaxID=357466 RepID=A0AAD4S6J3_9MAGN|nr:hypothetical protein MKW98_008858 [Papaver atlanticum]